VKSDFSSEAARCHRTEPAVLVELQTTVRDTAKAMCLFQDRVEYRGEIAGRAVDDLQDLRRGGLLLQSLARLGQEPRVLHRDHRLRREVLQQRDLLFGERSYFPSIDRYGCAP
jgi:hypothetical protein